MCKFWGIHLGKSMSIGWKRVCKASLSSVRARHWQAGLIDSSYEVRTSQYGLLAMLKVAEEICGEGRALNFNHFAGFSQSNFSPKVSQSPKFGCIYIYVLLSPKNPGTLLLTQTMRLRSRVWMSWKRHMTRIMAEHRSTETRAPVVLCQIGQKILFSKL